MGGGSSLELLLSLFSDKVDGSYWFLYAYLGMLLLLPFLRSIALRLKRDEIKYLLYLHLLVSSLIPMLSYIVLQITGQTFAVDLSLALVSVKQLFYPLLGYYFGCVYKIDSLSRKKLLGLWTAAIAGILVSCAFTYHQGMRIGYTQDFVQLFDWVTAIAVFITVRRVLDSKVEFSGRFPRLSRIIVFLGPLTFGVYLLDSILKSCFWVGFSGLLEPMLPTLLVSIAWCLVSFFLGSAITYAMKRMPGLRRVL